MIIVRKYQHVSVTILLIKVTVVGIVRRNGTIIAVISLALACLLSIICLLISFLSSFISWNLAIVQLS